MPAKENDRWVRFLGCFRDYFYVGNDTNHFEPQKHAVPEPEGEPAPEPNPGSSVTLAQSRKTQGIARRDLLLTWINKHGMTFNDGGKQLVLIEGMGVASLVPSCAMTEYLLTTVLGISSAFREGKDAINFLRAWILINAPTVMAATLAMALPGRIYIPARTGLLRITPSGVDSVRNISNEDRVWVTHPRNDPMAVDLTTYRQLCHDGLLAIERTIVGQMSVREPAMAWFSTVNGLWAPFLRQLFGARFITVHIGPSQAGKTTGAQLLLDALNLGAVVGDSSTAGLYSHDFGLLVMDNLELENWSPDIVRFVLQAATGARRIRGSRHGAPTESTFDQVVFVTSIEGGPRVELRERFALVEFQRSPQAFSRHDATAAVVEARGLIHAAIIATLERYLAMPSHPKTGKALNNFSDHYAAICGVMRCIGELLGRTGWAEEILQQWDRTLLASEQVERRSDELEAEVLNAIRMLTGRAQPFTYGGTDGRLYACTATELCNAMGAKNPSTLGRRLRGARFEELRILTDKEVRDVPGLKRTADVRTLGIFVPRQDSHDFGPPALLAVDASQHPHLAGGAPCHYLFDYDAREAVPGLLNALKVPADADLSSRQLNVIQELIVALRRLAPPEWADSIVIPIPNSAGVPTQLLPILARLGLGTVLPMVRWAAPMTPRAKDIAPEILAKHIVVDRELERQPTQILLVDDVLSTGLHFRAASLRLQELFPMATIRGLFVFRNASGRRAAAAGCG